MPSGGKWRLQNSLLSLQSENNPVVSKVNQIKVLVSVFHAGNEAAWLSLHLITAERELKKKKRTHRRIYNHFLMV